MNFRKQLNNLAFTLGKISCYQEAILIRKIAQGNSLYSFVPTKNLNSIFKYGLASSEYIKNNKALLKEIFPKEKDRKEWLEHFDEKDLTLKGPSVFFSKPDLQKILKINPKHPLSEDEFTLLKIDYQKLKQDYPETKIMGKELVPYKNNEYNEKKEVIEHIISDIELEEFSSKSFDETWSNYLPLEGFFCSQRSPWNNSKRYWIYPTRLFIC